jgi:hypothetical protein
MNTGQWVGLVFALASGYALWRLIKIRHKMIPPDCFLVASVACILVSSILQVFLPMYYQSSQEGVYLAWGFGGMGIFLTIWILVSL